MAALSDAQLWSVVRSQWGTGSDALTAFAVALAESGGDPTRTNTHNTNGTIDYGLFQINSVHSALLTGANWQDAQTNAHMAYTLYTAAGNKFTPWAAFNNGSFAGFLARAQAAAKTNANTPVPSAGDTATAPATPSDPNAAAVATVTSAGTWQRIGMFLAGGALILIFMVSVIKNTSVGKTVGHIAKTAVKVAAA